MRKEWDTREEDLELANRVIAYYAPEGVENDTMKLHGIQDGELKIHLPDWLKVLTHCYHKVYGREKGFVIMERVMTSLMLRDEVIH